MFWHLRTAPASFPACWRQANVTPIPKDPPSSSVANYRPISLTSVLSKVFERLVSVRLGQFMERSGVLLTTQFAYRKGLGTCDALLCVSHTLQSALESGQDNSDRIQDIYIVYTGYFWVTSQGCWGHRHTEWYLLFSRNEMILDMVEDSPAKSYL